MSMVQLFGYLVAICVSIWGVFGATEKVVCAEYRKEFAQRLREFDMKQWGREWPREVLHLFDNTFGAKPLTWRFFLRSVVCSVVFYILVAITYTSISPNYEFKEFLDFPEFAFPAPVSQVAALSFMLVFVLIFNATADYISLLETRWMIRHLANNPSFRPMVIILLMDLIVTAVIFMLWLPIGIGLLLLILNTTGGLWFEISEVPWYLPLLELSVATIFDLLTTPPSTGVNNEPVYFTFYTTFATSIWVWVNIAGLCCLGLLRNVCNPLWLWLRDTFLATNERPFLIVGYTICLCILIFGTIVIAIYKGVTVLANF